MNEDNAIQIVEEFQKWRRGEKPYDYFPCEMPYTPKEFGEAIDILLKMVKK